MTNQQVEVWVRLDATGMWMGYCTSPTRVDKGEFAALEDGLDECRGWDCPNDMGPCDTAWTTQHEWLRSLLSAWDMDPTHAWEFFDTTVPLAWAIRAGVVWEEEDEHGDTTLVMPTVGPEHRAGRVQAVLVDE